MKQYNIDGWIFTEDAQGVLGHVEETSRASTYRAEAAFYATHPTPEQEAEWWVCPHLNIQKKSREAAERKYAKLKEQEHA